ncbi:unnamed protein product [Kuraishia capsulata CBS 1993]|uniref:LicD/FKTN/FKRP nucleotidyltransferase domain-containing protein n=1 Tax=Kuraishia capsulata CBS 1993 TaxID=1382522 RepID=W6MVP0_9ASCO|nr:uncharacterized protein KUCA_T00006022001 [Kuraishia capsulata CBS 1993]CDK30027.1 unnamed protein product [Kuraishia capsulata CBS 1993]
MPRSMFGWKNGLPTIRRPRSKALVVLCILLALITINVGMSVTIGTTELPEIDLVKARDYYKGMVDRIKDTLSSVNSGVATEETLREKWLDKLNPKADPERFWQFDLDLGLHKSITLDPASLREIYKKGFSYDPRVTYSVYLNRINSNPGSPISFSWGDWVDMTPLNPYVAMPEGSRPSCAEISDNGVEWMKKVEDAAQTENGALTKRDADADADASFLNRSPRQLQANSDTSGSKKAARKKKLRSQLPVSKKQKFCYDDSEYRDKYPERAHRKLPGFNFHHRSNKATFLEKVLYAKSYMNAVAPVPKTIIFTSGEGLFEVEVDQQAEQADMAESGLLEDYVAKHTLPSGFVDFDPSLEFAEMSKIVQPLTPLRNLHSTTEIPLPESLFKFNPNEMVAEYAEFAKTGMELSSREQTYYESLQYSLSLTPKEIPKYFSEVNIHWPATYRGHRVSENGGHYDWRFFNGFISEGSLDKQYDGNNEDRRRMILHRMLKSWLAFTHEAGVVSWIAHGTLLAWYWDGFSFPWDDDIDVSMPIEELNTFSLRFNQSVVVADLDLGFGKYFIDCGTFITHRIKGNGRNNIDARFIDIDSGLFIDITGLALTSTPISARYFKRPELHLDVQKEGQEDLQYTQNEKVQAYNCRNNHFYLHEELSPLRLSMADGSLALIPNNYQSILKAEYSRGLVSDKFNKHVYIPLLRLWIPLQTLTTMKQNGAFKEYEKTLPKANQHGVKSQPLIHLLRDRSSVAFTEVLLGNDDILREYYLTHIATELHDREMKLLKDGGQELTEFAKGLKSLAPFRKDPFVFRQEVLALKQQRDASV